MHGYGIGVPLTCQFNLSCKSSQQCVAPPPSPCGTSHATPNKLINSIDGLQVEAEHTALSLHFPIKMIWCVGGVYLFCFCLT